ncbi:beta-lactamase [Natrialba chahannaoensis JCM 10990]|uniref:Beta-lactamase n=1 Tax=Natrialba chahannaoensis JCM 10990 TaxID=1227492 RepID=M0B7S0_9EURY|nr:MBL fold metallo-hydrolase [Natrialba chahannaoensis]ELZ06333.1 beta-lactamase [Natrialba chahannaoensis JCM 10990]
MAIGDVREVTVGDCSDLYYVDTGMFEIDEFGAVYILDDERPAIVETGVGTNYELVLDALAELDIAPEDVAVITVTHIHLDHAGGAGLLAEACPNADVYISGAGASLLADPGKLVAGTKNAVGDQWQYYVQPASIPEDRIVELEDGDVIDLGEHELRVHAAPGHAFHQVVFEDPANDAVFTGDAAGIWIPDHEEIVETSPPSDFDLEQCLADTRTIADIDPDVLLYTHFGPRYVGDDAERVLEEYATVLTEWVNAVEAKRDELADDELMDHFAAATDHGDAWNDEKASAEAAMNVRGTIGYLDDRE